jgi:hypothetical protein
MCPCMVFADLHTRVKYNTTRRGPDECTLCVHFALLWPGIPIVLSSVLSFLYLPAAWAVWLPMHGYVSWFSAPTRTKLRHKYAIDRFRVPLFGVPLSDGCLHTWCMACSLLQVRLAAVRLVCNRAMCERERERVDLVGSHGRWKRPCLQTSPHGRMIY